jgi:hypothetical protein
VASSVVLVLTTVAVGRIRRSGRMVKQQDTTGKERRAEESRRDETVGVE